MRASGFRCLLLVGVLIPRLPAAELDSVEPACVRAEGTTVLTIRGSDFDPDYQLEIGGAPFAIDFVDQQTLRVTLDGLDEGIHDVELLVNDGTQLVTLDTIENGLRALGTPSLQGVEPCYLSTAGGQRVRLRGRNFCPQFSFLVQATRVGFTQVQWISEDVFEATSPALAEGNHRLELRDGTNLLDSLMIEYRPPEALPRISEVTPSLVLERANSVIDIRVSQAPSRSVIALNGTTQSRLVRTDTGFSGAVLLSAGVYDVELLLAGSVCAVARGALTVLPPVSGVNIEPTEVSTVAPTTVDILVDHLHETTRFRLEDFTEDLVGEAILDRQGAPIGLRATVPPLPPGLQPGPRTLALIDARGQVTFEEALTYVEPPPEATLDGVSPDRIASTGRESLVVTGTGFTSEQAVWIGNRALGSQRFISPTRIEGQSPPLDPGVYPLRLIDGDDEIARLEQAVTVVDPPPPATLSGVVPDRLQSDGGESLVVSGTGLTARHEVRIGDRPIESPSFVSATRIEGLSPALAAGVYALRLIDLDDGREVTRLEAAVTVVDPRPQVSLAGIAPDRIESAGGEALSVTGSGFQGSHQVWIGDRSLADQRIQSSTRIAGRSPALTPGVYALRLVDGADGAEIARLEGAVTVLEPSPAILGVGPDRLPTDGALVEFVGENFASGQTPRLGGQDLSDAVLVSPTRWRGRSPGLAPGFYDATLLQDGEIVARLDRAVEVLAPPSLTGVTPRSVERGTGVILNGAEFRPGLRASFGGREVVALRVDSSGRASAQAPAGEPGPQDVRIWDAFGESVLPAGVVYVQPPRPPITPPPQEFITSLAEGTARFAWVNPVPYSRIEVYDEGGQFLLELQGDTRTLELALDDQDRLDLTFVGVQEANFSDAAWAVAFRKNCDRPSPLAGSGVRGFLEFYLYGGPRPLIFLPLALDSFGDFTTFQGQGAGQEESEGPGRGAGIADDLLSLYALPATNGVQQPVESVGYVLSEDYLSSIPPELRYRNKLTTGFVLEQPARKLEVAAYYAKLATAADLDLRGRLTLVKPAEEGQEEFRYEFTFPDVLISPAVSCDASGEAAGEAEGGGAAGDVVIPELLLDNVIDRGQQWNCTVIFRGETDPDSDMPCEVGEILDFPAGEYLFDIFVVGGDRALPYYVFTDDIEQEELLIPGVPCPPYPLVRVTDMTGLRTLPVVTGIDGSIETLAGGFGLAQEATVFRAEGAWLDSECHSLDPDDPSALLNPDHEYTWTFLDFSPPCVKKTNIPRLVTQFEPGCYRVDLTVSDQSCGISKTRSFEVPVLPPVIPCPTRPHDFSCPTPDPGGIYGVIGLDDVPNGSFDGLRRLEVRVLVSSRDCGGAETCPDECAAPRVDPCDPTQDEIQFRLAYSPHANPSGRVSFFTPLVFDLCPNNPVGPKFFHVIVPDLTALPPLAADQLFFRCFLQAKALSEPSSACPTSVGLSPCSIHLRRSRRASGRATTTRAMTATTSKPRPAKTRKPFRTAVGRGPSTSWGS